MSAYLKFYDLEHSPFEGGTHSKVVLGTKALRDSLEKIRSGLEEGAARICVNGQAGLGKTSLARALPKLLDEPMRVAVILDPTSSWDAIRKSVAKQWKVGDGGLARSNLVSFSAEARLVLVLDQAEKASADILDHLDVMLSYRSENDEPVVQSVLFANLSRSEDGEPAPIIWWLDRIQTLELRFAPLPREGVASYIEKHLKRAGWKDGSLFDADAAHAIHGYTSGIPGEVDRVCEQLLNEAAEQNIRGIDAAFVHQILDEVVEEEEEAEATSLGDEPDLFENRFEALVHEEEFAGAEHAAPPAYESNESVTTAIDESDEEAGLSDPVEDEGKAEDASDDEPEEATVNLVLVSDETATEADDEAEEAEAVTLELVDAVAEAEDADETEPFDEEDESERGLDSRDASLIELEAYLSRPPSDEELREIQGHRFARHGRMAAAIAVVIALGSMTLVWLGDDKSDPLAKNDAAKTAEELHSSISDPTLFAGPDGLSTAESKPEILVKLRGPITLPTEDALVDRGSASLRPDEKRPSGGNLVDPWPAARGDFDPEPGLQ